MEANHSLPRDQRLSSRGSIRRLFESGQSGFVYPLRYMWFAQEAEVAETEREGESKSQQVEQEGQTLSCEVLFTVPKRFHKRANKRNTLRRRVKESYRLRREIILSHPSTKSKIEMALVYSTREVHTYKTIDNAVRKILESIANSL